MSLQDFPVICNYIKSHRAANFICWSFSLSVIFGKFTVILAFSSSTTYKASTNNLRVVFIRPTDNKIVTLFLCPCSNCLLEKFIGRVWSYRRREKSWCTRLFAIFIRWNETVAITVTVAVTVTAVFAFTIAKNFNVRAFSQFNLKVKLILITETEVFTRLIIVFVHFKHNVWNWEVGWGGHWESRIDTFEEFFCVVIKINKLELNLVKSVVWLKLFSMRDTSIDNKFWCNFCLLICLP